MGRKKDIRNHIRGIIADGCHDRLDYPCDCEVARKEECWGATADAILVYEATEQIAMRMDLHAYSPRCSCDQCEEYMRGGPVTIPVMAWESLV